jgi:hypothetical protein
MAEKKWARIADGAIAEVIPLDASLALDQVFHPDYAKAFVDITRVMPAPVVGWLHGGGLKFSPPPPPSREHTVAVLTGYASTKRFEVETGGITLGKMTIATDRESQARLAAAWVTAKHEPSTVFHWKLPDGTFAELSAESVSMMAAAVAAHVQACYAIERKVCELIGKNKISVRSQINKAFE